MVDGDKPLTPNLEGAVRERSVHLELTGFRMAIVSELIVDRAVGCAENLDEIAWGNGFARIRIRIEPDRAPWIAEVASESAVLRMPPGLPLIDVVTVADGHVPSSDRLVHSTLGEAMRYRSHRIEGDRLVVELADDAGRLDAALMLQAPAGLSVLRSHVRLRTPDHASPIVVRSVTSFSAYLGSAGGEDAVPAWDLWHARSDWLGEGRWESLPLNGRVLPALEEQLTGHNPRGEVRFVSSGTWSTGRVLPTAVAVSGTSSAAWAWQIEHNGAWRFDLGQDTADRWFALSGPTDDDHQFTLVLSPGQSFESVPIALTVADGLTRAVANLTTYRRAVRRPHPDNSEMPVVFNDYMNTLNGDPTTERLLPLIDAAAAVGAEVFCIDAGWYADGFWWDSVGEWVASQSRFPGGLGLVVDHIRDRGMVPGLWLEPEVIGVNSPLASTLPAESFLQRHGQRIVEHERYHLDLRHPAALAHLNDVVDRLVVQYGVGFFKFDYNIDPGPGTDRDADSVGDGLLQHNRAHLAWLDGILDRHPHLVIENCGSGAMRSDFAMLSRLQMQSTSDQQDFRRYPPIAAAAPMQMLPEQAASWAYPQPEMSEEEVAFSLITGLLGRFYLSGYLNRMDDAQRAMVAEAIRLAKQLRPEISASAPFWPAGLPSWDDPTVALGLHAGGDRLISVWDRHGDADIHLDLPGLRQQPVEVDLIFPSSLPSWTTAWDRASGTLRVHNPTGAVGARLFRIRSRHRD